jgi:hypothetical protein
MNTKQKLDEDKKEYEIFLSIDERFKRLKHNEQRQILNVLVKKSGAHGLKNVARSIVMDARGY